MRRIDPLDELRRAIEAAGSQRKWAMEHGFSPAFVNDVLSGRRDASERVLVALRLQRLVRYRRIPDDAA